MLTKNGYLKSYCMEEEIMEEYLTAKQVAEYLQVKPLTIYQWAREEKIPAIKIGRIWRFKKEAIDNFLEEQLHEKGHQE